MEVFLNVNEFVKLSQTERISFQVLKLTGRVSGHFHTNISFLSRNGELENAEAPPLLEFCTALSQCINVQQLTLRETALGNLDVSSFGEICRTIAQLRLLEKLSLLEPELYLLEPHSFIELGEALAHCHKLSEILYCEGIDLDDGPENGAPNAFRGLCRAIGRSRGLKSLHFGYSGLHKLDVDSLQIFGESLSRCQMLEELILPACAGIDVSNTVFQAFCVALSQCRTLQKLRIPDSHFYRFNSRQLFMFSTVIENCTALQEFDFSDQFSDLDHVEDADAGFANPWRAAQTVYILSRSWSILQIRMDETMDEDSIKELKAICVRNHNNLIIRAALTFSMLKSKRTNGVYDFMDTILKIDPGSSTSETSSKPKEIETPNYIRDKILCYAFPGVRKTTLINVEKSVDKILKNKVNRNLEELCSSDTSNKRRKIS